MRSERIDRCPRCGHDHFVQYKVTWTGIHVAGGVVVESPNYRMPRVAYSCAKCGLALGKFEVATAPAMASCN